jgi:hypothetical protein
VSSLPDATGTLTNCFGAVVSLRRQPLSHSYLERSSCVARGHLRFETLPSCRCHVRRQSRAPRPE